jgi:hypothetical protein
MVAAALASLLDTAPSWLPQVDHWEIAEDSDTWILSGQLAGDMSESAAFRLLAPMIERATSAHSDDGRLVKVPFEWDGVAGQVWYLRPVERYIVPERCASCPTLLAGVGTQFVRLGGRGAPVICVPCRDRMHEQWIVTACPAPDGGDHNWWYSLPDEGWQCTQCRMVRTDPSDPKTMTRLAVTA